MQDLASDLEDERTARIIAEEAATSNQKQAEAAAAEAASLRDQLARLTKQLAMHQEDPHSLHAHKPESQPEGHEAILSLQNQLADATAESQSWQRQVAQLSLQLEEQQRHSQQVAAEPHISLHITACESTLDAESLQQQLADLTEKLTEERERNQSLSNQISASAESATQTASANAELQTRLAELTQLVADKDQQSAESSRSMHQAELAKTEMTSLSSQLTQLTQQLSEQHEQCEGLTLRLTAAQEATVSTQEQQASLTELSSLRLQLTDVSGQLDAQREECTQLAAQREAAHQLADAKQHQAEDAVAAVTSLQEHLDVARQQLQASQHSSLQASQLSPYDCNAKLTQACASNLACICLFVGLHITKSHCCSLPHLYPVCESASRSVEASGSKFVQAVAGNLATDDALLRHDLCCL